MFRERLRWRGNSHIFMSPLLSPNIFVVIMAGGRGTRFWPRSRHQEPKQFINIVGSESLLRTTVNRLSGLVDKDHILDQYEAMIYAVLPFVETNMPTEVEKFVFYEIETYYLD